MQRRNLATYGMNWKERQEYRVKRSAQIANEKTAKQDTLSRLMDMIIAIEDAFKPEADQLFAKVVKSFTTAHAYVMDHGQTYNAVRTAYTGFDIDANRIPMFTGRKYVAGTFSKYTPEYEAYKKLEDFQSNIQAKFTGTTAATICVRKLYDLADLIPFAEKEAAEIVAANKAKLLQGVARYMGGYQTVEVKDHFVKQGVKGFQGEFTLITDKGPRLFTCKAITAEGPIVSFHWRYIIHVKEL